MTDFERVRSYYKRFDEKNRLAATNSGKLEYTMTKQILDKYLPESASVLDLGAGTGAYAFPLAEEGYQVVLADLSEDLIRQAKQEKEESGNDNIISCDIVNAIDLSIYADERFDAVLLLGPLYHMTEEWERKKCIAEIERVLKQGGVIFASFIPYLSGSIAIVDRYFGHPDQVDADRLKQVFQSGRFHNLSDEGFQEGYYAASDEIEKLFEIHGFRKLEIRSLRGFGYGKEDDIYKLLSRDREMFCTIIDMINKTAGEKEIIEMCGHAIYAGYKQ